MSSLYSLLCIHSGRHPGALFCCASTNSCGNSMDYKSSFSLKRLNGSGTCHTVVTDLLQMYNDWHPAGSGLTVADGTWQSILHELRGEAPTSPRGESLWATGGQGLEKIIPCHRMGVYRERAVEWTWGPRAVFALLFARTGPRLTPFHVPRFASRGLL